MTKMANDMRYFVAGTVSLVATTVCAWRHAGGMFGVAVLALITAFLMLAAGAEAYDRGKRGR